MIPVPPPAPLDWEQIVKLARRVVRVHRVDGSVDVEPGLRLAYAVLAFQEQLAGNGTERVRPKSNGGG